MEAYPEGFDLAKLLAPISEDAPAGADLRKDYSPNSLYYRLRDARAEARAAERAADAGSTEGSTAPQWRPVRDLAIEALSTQSKDLEIAAWLTESLLRGDGLVGLSAGFELMAGLAENFWEGFFPELEEDGLAGRLAAVSGLNGLGGEGTLIQPLRRLVLFPRPDGTPFEIWQYQQSREVAGIGDETRRQQRFDSGVLPFDVVENEARAAGGAVFAELQGHAAEAVTAWQSLGEVFDRQAGADAPPTSQVRDLLQQIEEVAKRFASPEAAAIEAATASAPEQIIEAVGTGPVPAPAALASREDALRTLAQIADFFRRTEPNSPLAYTLQEAVRRGRMTWPELLAEIVPDPAVRSAILSSLGIRPPPEEPS
jgi:type VI secretion system protein ImpA